MAHLLYRLGRTAATRPIIVMTAWIVALVAAGGSFVAFSGTLANSFSIPGLETEKVTDELAQELPDLTGGSARVVFATEDGSAFTSEQQAAISEALASAVELDQVASVVDPFELQAQRAEQAQQLADGAAAIEQGQAQIDAGVAQLEASQAELEAGQTQLDAGQAQLDAAIAQAKAAGQYEAAKATFDAQQAQLDAQQAQIDAGQAQIDAGREELVAGQAELDAQATQLELATELSGYAAAIRTVSDDGSTALGALSLSEAAYALTPELKQEVISVISAQPIDGVTVNFSSELTTDVSDVLGVGEVVGVILALVVLYILMRAIWPAVQPILSSIIGVGVGLATALAFSGIVDMQSITPVLGAMLGLAVGIDYSLFITNRHRTQVRQGMDVTESIGLANGTAGNAVVFAGSTVMVALLALNVTGIPFLGIMGTVAAFCVAVAVLVAITLTPAILGLIGPKVLSKAARASQNPHEEKPIKAMRTRTAVAAALGAIAVLAVFAIPSLSMRLGLPDGTQEPTDSTQYKAYFGVAEAFGEGFNGTMLVTASLPEATTEADLLAKQTEVAAYLMTFEDVAAVAPIGANEALDYLAFQVIPSEGPNSESTVDLVHNLRDAAVLDDGTVLGVAGEASGTVDVITKLTEALPLYLAVVVGLSLVILVLVFRSILVPLMATGGFVLSLFAAFGAVTAVYQWGWLSDLFGVHDPAPLLAFLPILLTGILFGLAMDYQLFITTGMREAYVHGADARTAVVAGVRHGRAVVTAAAIIMVSVFGGFVFSHLAMVRPIGFGLAVGVIFDAFVVRMVLIPALMHLAGEKAWWLPKWLDKILPNVDVEGSQLEREHPVPATH